MLTHLLVHLTLVKLVSGPSTGGALSPSASEPHWQGKGLSIDRTRSHVV